MLAVGIIMVYLVGTVATVRVLNDRPRASFLYGSQPMAIIWPIILVCYFGWIVGVCLLEAPYACGKLIGMFDMTRKLKAKIALLESEVVELTIKNHMR